MQGKIRKSKQVNRQASVAPIPAVGVLTPAPPLREPVATAWPNPQGRRRVPEVADRLLHAAEMHSREVLPPGAAAGYPAPPVTAPAPRSAPARTAGPCRLAQRSRSSGTGLSIRPTVIVRPSAWTPPGPWMPIPVASRDTEATVWPSASSCQSHGWAGPKVTSAAGLVRE
jgi:hypothetical protein